MENGAFCFLKQSHEGIAVTRKSQGRHFDLAFFCGISEKYRGLIGFAGRSRKLS